MNKGTLPRTNEVLVDMLLAGFLSAGGYAQQPAITGPPSSSSQAASPASNSVAEPAKAASVPRDKVVLKVASQQVTKADFDYLISTLDPQAQQAVASRGYRPIGEEYALALALAQKAVQDHLDSSPEFVKQVARQRIQLLAEAEYAKLANQTKATQEEINQYYLAHKAEFEERTVRRIFIRKKPEGAKEGTLGLVPQDAKARADSIRKELTAGKGAKEVAQEFKSPGEGLIDTEPQKVRLAQFPAEWQTAVPNLKDGEVSEALETPQGIAFFQMLGRRQVELKDVSSEIEVKLREQKLQVVFADLKNKAGVWMDEEYFTAPPAAPPATGPQPPATSQPSKPTTTPQPPAANAPTSP